MNKWGNKWMTGDHLWLTEPQQMRGTTMNDQQWNNNHRRWNHPTMSYRKWAKMTSIIVWALDKFFVCSFLVFFFFQLTNCISLFFRIYTTVNDGYWCTTPPPAPASQTTACGVDCGSKDDDTKPDHDSTPYHCHEPLLVGWKGVLHERDRWARGCFPFLFLYLFLFLNQ
jgi:hypothetical protein